MAIEEKARAQEFCTCQPSRISFNAIHKHDKSYLGHHSLILKLTHNGRVFSSKKIEGIGGDCYIHQYVDSIIQNFKSGLFKLHQPMLGIIIISIPYNTKKTPLSIVLTEK